MALSWGFGGFAKRIYIGNVFAATDRGALLGQSGSPCMAVTLFGGSNTIPVVVLDIFWLPPGIG
jgi:hypothetical protein